MRIGDCISGRRKQSLKAEMSLVYSGNSKKGEDNREKSEGVLSKQS